MLADMVRDRGLYERMNEQDAEAVLRLDLLERLAGGKEFRTGYQSTPRMMDRGEEETKRGSVIEAARRQCCGAVISGM